MTVQLCYFYPNHHEAHFEAGHPERPERIEAICSALDQAGWWAPFPKLEPTNLPNGLVAQVHEPRYLETLKSACLRGNHLDMDTYTTPASWQLAWHAAGGGVAVADAVWKGEFRRGFALTRPPGHHATKSMGMGFCLMNNIALAAEHLLRSSDDVAVHPDRIAIVDLDLHHGNGTQDIFYERSDVFYISTHQRPLYPGSGSLEERGQGEGFGFTANIPLSPYSGDEAFHVAMEELILPLLDSYQPEMLLVSYGFDPHWRDPLGSLLLSASGFGALFSSMIAWADANCSGKIAVFLEGGYDLDAARTCSRAVVAALLGEQIEDSVGPSPYKEGDGWKQIVRDAKKLWFKKG